MTMLHAFLYGLILAFGLIVPLGVQNIFIFNQGAHQHRIRDAMPSVITATCCDTCLIIASVFGISMMILALPWLKATLLSCGIIFLIIMAWYIWHTQPSQPQEGKKPFHAKQQILFSASVSLLNPHAILDTIGVIGTNSLQFYGPNKIVFTTACVITSAIWFFTLAILGHFFKKADPTGRWLRKMNQLSAIIMASIALYMSYTLIHTFS